MSADRLHTYLMPTSQRILRAIVDERRRLLARELHAEVQRMPIEDRLAKLKSQADACRQQAILLNAKLAALSGETLQGADAIEGVSVIEKLRETLVQSSAQIDHGVAGIVGDDDLS